MTAGDWVQALITLAAAVLASGSVVAVLRDRRERREASARQVAGQPANDLKAVSGAAVEIIQELQEELATARQATATVARLEASVAALESRIVTILSWIHEPTMTIEMLRRLTPAGPPQLGGQQNGRTP